MGRGGWRWGRSPPDHSAEARRPTGGSRSAAVPPQWIASRLSLKAHDSRRLRPTGTRRHVLEPATNPTAADDRDEFGRPKSALSWGQLFSVTAYWLAITTLWGAFTFSGVYTAQQPGVAASRTTTGNGLADMLLGQAATTVVGTRSGENPIVPYWGTYIQDNWKVSPQAVHPDRHGDGSPLPDLRGVGVLEPGLLGVRGGRRASSIQQQLRAGALPGLHPGPRAGAPGGDRLGPAWCGQHRRQPARAGTGHPVRGDPAGGAWLSGDHAGPVCGNRGGRGHDGADHRLLRA